MPRTTINIDPIVLRQLKQRGEREGKSLGDLVSELLARALSEDRDGAPRPLRLQIKQMHARVDFEDRDAVQRILGGS